MSRKIIGLGFTNRAKGEKWNNNAVGGIGARNRGVKRALLKKTGTNCVCINFRVNNDDTTFIDPRLTRIVTNPAVDVLIEGELNAAKLQKIANDNNADFTNPTEIIIGTQVTGISSDLLQGIAFGDKRLRTFGFKAGGTHKCTVINNNAFELCNNLTAVTIPNSVTSIGNQAFRFCTGLNSVTIPDSVSSIGSSAFRFCTGLNSVTIPDSVTSIGSAAFFGCDSLTSVTIPNSVTSIGNQAFRFCGGLTSVTFKAGINTTIGTDAFSDIGFTNNELQDATSIEIPVGENDRIFTQ